MNFPPEVTNDVLVRLRRVEGQIRGLQRLIEEGQDCRKIVTQLTAAESALHRAGYKLMAAGLRYCVTEPEAAAEAGMTVDDMEELFLKLG